MNVIELAVVAFVEFFAVYLGIKYSWEYERRKEKQIYLKRIIRIVPNIYIELLENLRMMSMYQSYDHYQRNVFRFKTSLWEMFKVELARACYGPLCANLSRNSLMRSRSAST
jgi:hypothetical protein